MNNWSIVPLKGHISEVSNRKGDTPAEILSVTNSGGFVRSLDIFDKQVFSQDASTYKLVQLDDLAYNPSRINVGSVARCEFLEGGAVSPMYTVVRCKESLLPQFLLYFLKSEMGQQHIAHRCIGAVRFMLRFSDLEQIEMPIPPLADQMRVVGILDQVASIGELRKVSDRNAENLTPAIYVDLFGDPASNGKAWPQVPLGSLICDGPQNGLYKHASFYGEGVRILRIDSFSDGEIKKISGLKQIRATQEEIDRYSLRAHDLVVNRVNSPELLGKSVLIPELDEPVLFESNMMRFAIDKNKANPEYIAWMLQTDLAKNHIQGRAKRAIGQSSINQTDIKTLVLPLPPLNRQEEFASRIGDLHEIRRYRTDSAERLKDLGRSITYRAFEGQL